MNTRLLEFTNILLHSRQIDLFKIVLFKIVFRIISTCYRQKCITGSNYCNAHQWKNIKLNPCAQTGLNTKRLKLNASNSVLKSRTHWILDNLLRSNRRSP